MPVFDILCLANSHKRRGSCVAGLRLDGGGWVRPVAVGTPSGELYPAHYLLPDGTSPQIFDCIRIAFLEPKPLPHQPENWMIADEPWQLLSRGLSIESVRLLEGSCLQAPGLFGDFSNRIQSSQIESKLPGSSLCVIRPNNLCWTIEHHSYNAHKASALFQLAGTSYKLPVTDPAWLDVFRSLTPGKYPITACGIPAGCDVLLTISLTEPWDDGACYKLVAGILPLGEVEPSGAATGSASIDAVAGSMEPDEAMRIVEVLAHGMDPRTGERFPEGSPLSHPDTVRALRAAVSALRSGTLPTARRDLPARAGEWWDEPEDDTLAREFDAGESIAAMARLHGRTPGAIKTRLVRLGKIA